MKKFIIVSLCGLISISGYTAKVVATVNGKKITEDQLNKSYNENLLYVGQDKVTKKKVLKDLINREIGIQRALKNKINKDPVVRSKMNDIMYHAQISKDLEPMLKKIKVTDADVKKYYKENPEYRTAHILLRLRAKSTKKENAAVLKIIMGIYDKLKVAPEKFSELANKYSQTSAAPTGGDIGFQPAILLAPEYFAAIKGQKNGFITAPFKTQLGFHIVKVLSVKDFSKISMPLYKKTVYDLKRNKIMDKYFSDLRKKAKISIKDSSLKL